MQKRIKVVNLISGFNDGGAKRVVYEITKRFYNDIEFDVRICVICKNDESKSKCYNTPEWLFAGY